jgi:hypothetical protein
MVAIHDHAKIWLIKLSDEIPGGRKRVVEPAPRHTLIGNAHLSLSGSLRQPEQIISDAGRIAVVSR